MERVDFKKKYREFFNASDKKVLFVKIPDFKYLTIKGKGHPDGNPEFEQKIGAIYAIAYTLKFMFKDVSLQPEGYFDFVIPPMGARWWTDGMDFSMENKDEWQWELTVMMAEYINDDHLGKAKTEIRKKKDPSPWLDDVKLKILHEGEVAMMMHIGPYNEVGNTYEKLFSAMKEAGREPAEGKCHEIYLNDPRRTAHHKLKTVVRVSC